MKQSTALAILKTGQNVFLTGQAGAGKTYVLNQYIDYLRARCVPTAITASTGIAATHMNGMTIHSWSGIGIQNDIAKVNLKRLAEREEFVERMKKVKVLIVDEISMLHLKQVETIDAVLRHFKEGDLPFGGVQVIFSGDFFQLPPIGEKGESAKEKYAFMAKAWAACNFQICYLTEQHRQAGNDERARYGLSLNDILNQIRAQTVTHEAIDVLKATEANTISMQRTRLYTHNADVDKINGQELDKLPTTAVTYQAICAGEKILQESLVKSVRAPESLTLKIGAKVMFVKNMPLVGVFNGTMGTVVAFSDTNSKRYEACDDMSGANIYPVVRLNDGGELIAEPESWTVDDEKGEILASFSQLPLCLAWAITVHKSQGMTLDAAEIDLSRTFEKGQGYVALSRLRGLDGLQLLGFNQKALLLDEWVQAVDKRLIELSAEHADNFAGLNDDMIDTLHKRFIEVSGGLTDEKQIAIHEAYWQQQRAARLRIAEKKAAEGNDSAPSKDTGGITGTYAETLKLIKEGLSISEMAMKRALAESTIMNHLEKISQTDSSVDISAYRPDDAMVEAVQTSFNTLDAEGEFIDGVKLRPIVEALEHQYSYNEVRLALLFIKKEDAEATANQVDKPSAADGVDDSVSQPAPKPAKVKSSAIKSAALAASRKGKT